MKKTQSAILTNAKKHSDAVTVHGASPMLTMSHPLGKFCLSYDTPRRSFHLGHAFLLSCWNICVSFRKVSSRTLNTCVKSDYVLRWSMIKLQFDFECLCLPKPRDRSPLQKDRKPFFSVISTWVWRDFPLLKFTKSVAVCIMHVSLSSVVGLQ